MDLSSRLPNSEGRTSGTRGYFRILASGESEDLRLAEGSAAGSVAQYCGGVGKALLARTRSISGESFGWINDEYIALFGDRYVHIASGVFRCGADGTLGAE